MSVLIPDSTSSTSPPRELWPTYGPLIADWMESTLVFGEGDRYGEPVELRDDQLLILYRWYEFEADAEGNFVRWRYDELFLEFATGWGKTEFGAWLALAELAGPLAPLTPNIPVAAASYEQADLLFGRARQIGEHANCRLRPYLECYDTEILLKDRPGRIFRIAAVAGTNEGGIPTVFMADEIHEWVGGKERLHVVVRKSLRKRVGSRTINMSTPGHNLDTLAGRIHTVGLEGSNPRLLHVTHTYDESLKLNDPVQLRTALRQANPWKDERAIEQLIMDFATMPLHEFLRYHLCVWVPVPKESWLLDKPGAWEACAGRAHITKGQGRIAIGIDMSLNRDTTSVAIAQRRGDGRVPVRARIFDPADFPNGRIDFELVKTYVRQLVLDLNADVVVYDPRFLEFEAQRMEDEGLPMEEMWQSPERMAPACALAFDFIVGGVVEQPDDKRLTDHVMAAVKRETDRGWTLTKKNSSGPIDGCMAMIMAISAAMAENETEQPGAVYFFD